MQFNHYTVFHEHWGGSKGHHTSSAMEFVQQTQYWENEFAKFSEQNIDSSRKQDMQNKKMWHALTLFSTLWAIGVAPAIISCSIIGRILKATWKRNQEVRKPLSSAFSENCVCVVDKARIVTVFQSPRKGEIQVSSLPKVVGTCCISDRQGGHSGGGRLCA